MPLHLDTPVPWRVPGGDISHACSTGRGCRSQIRVVVAIKRATAWTGNTEPRSLTCYIVIKLGRKTWNHEANLHTAIVEDVGTHHKINRVVDLVSY
jgi:hypothetical protein